MWTIIWIAIAIAIVAAAFLLAPRRKTKQGGSTKVEMTTDHMGRGVPLVPASYGMPGDRDGE